MKDNFEEDGIVTLTDEAGHPYRFEFLDLIEYEEEDYIVLFPEESDETSQAVILRVIPLEGDEEELDETYVGISDQETIDAVYQIFLEKNAQYLNGETQEDE